MNNSRSQERPIGAAAGFGARLRCPACGQGRLFRSYLKVNEHCPSCGEALHHHRADDMPPHITILIAGAVMALLVVWMETALELSAGWELGITLPLAVLLVLGLLPIVKGALIGVQWALRMHGFKG
jgi:uncharacterized protein (DUF983 family)